MAHTDNPQPSHKVCEIHFHYTCKTGFNSQLHENSLPTLHLPVQTNTQWTNSFWKRLELNEHSNGQLNAKVNLQVENNSDICRLCYSKGILYNIHESKYKNQLIVQLIYKLIAEKPPKVKDLPIHMCLDCIELIIISCLTVKRIKVANTVYSYFLPSSTRFLPKNCKKLSTLKPKTPSLTYPQKIDFKTILADCDLKIRECEYIKCDPELVIKETEIDTIQETEPTAVKQMPEGIFVKEELYLPESPENLNANFIENEGKTSSIADSYEKDGEHSVAKYRCTKCKKSFRGLLAFRQHNRNHHSTSRGFLKDDKASTEARKCSREKMKKIKRTNSQNRLAQLLIECKICRKKFKKSQIEEHMANHENRCDKCGSNFSTLKQLREHKKSDHPEYCAFCKKTFRSKINLSHHMKSHLDQKLDCSFCNKKCKNIYGLSYHLKKTHKNSNLDFQNNETIQTNSKVELCQICGKVALNMKQHILTHSSLPKKYQCQQCPYGTNNSSVLLRHQTVHTGARPFLCIQCGRAYTQKVALDYHSKLHETLTIPVKCSECDETFTTKYDCKVHGQTHGIKMRPSNYKKSNFRENKPINCPECNEELLSEVKLHLHLKAKHDVDTPIRFTCPFCPKAYDTHMGRYQHIRNIHSNRDKESECVNCAVCDRVIPNRMFLKIHMRVHTGERPYKCDICPSAFKQSQQLKGHKLRIHEDKRPFACAYCKKAFRSSSEVKEHERTHTGETLSCKLCDKTFKQRSNRSKHMREVHNIRMREKYSRQQKEDDGMGVEYSTNVE